MAVPLFLVVVLALLVAAEHWGWQRALALACTSCLLEQSLWGQQAGGVVRQAQQVAA